MHEKQLIPLIATSMHLYISLLLLQHPLELSTLLQEHIISICRCGDIIVNITVMSCADQTAMYSIRLIGVMATEAVLSLITNMQSLTEGLDLGIVTLFLQEDGTSSELNYDGQQMAVQPETPTVIIILSVIIAMLLLILLLIAVLCLR